MKKIIKNITTTLILLLVFCINIAASFASGFDAVSGTLTISEYFSAGNINTKIDRNLKGNNYTDVKILIISAGELNAADCKFINQNLTNLEELTLDKTANFVNGEIPKSAFEENVSLRKIRAENVTSIGLKAFSLCRNLEEADFPKVTKIGVQAFAQAKGSNSSRLKSAKFPNLRSMEQRVFYYCVNLEALYLNAPPKLIRPQGKEGLWFSYVTNMTIYVPNRAVYENFIKIENCEETDWSAYNFIAVNGEKLPDTQQAPGYNDADYNFLRNQLLPTFDKTNKDFSGKYYTGDFKTSLNMYTFNMNLNAWISNTSTAPKLTALDAIRWAKKAGFDAVDITCYYIPGYSNTTMPTLPEKDILKYAREIKALCAELGIEISGTGIQNNFADPNETRRNMDIDRAKFWIKVAHEMGAPVIRLFAGTAPVDIRREGWEKIAKERMTPDIRKIAEYAKTNYPDVKIGIQNHGDMLATANQVMQLLKWIDCDNVGVVNDTGFYREFLNNDATRYDWYSDIALILPYSNNFQIKKKPGGAETTELMDLNRLMTDIRKSPYRGYIPIELLWLPKDNGYPGALKTPPYEETLAFLAKLKQAMEATKGEISKSDSLAVNRYERINLALNPKPENIKTGSFRGLTSGVKAFDGNSTGTSGSGYQVDASQGTTPGKETFWLAVDLGEEKTIHSFGVAWGTSVGNLKNRLKNGTYRVEYTNDPAKWIQLSDAKESGKNGLSGYNKPSGWTVAYTQNVNDLPDANGNKVFISPAFEPIKARYVMVTGELASGWIEIYNFFVFQKVLTDKEPVKPVYPTEDLARIRPDYSGMSLTPGRPAIVKQGGDVPAYHISAQENISVSGKLIDPNGKTIYTHPAVNIKKNQIFNINPNVSADASGTYKMVFTIKGNKTVYDTYYFTAVDDDISKYNFNNPYPAIYMNDGKLVYIPDYRGNTVIDYSNAGYKGGGVAIPNIPVKIILEPSPDIESDDTERIQNAVNMLGRIDPDKNGFRGAVLLKAGAYRVSNSIRIDKSGIVIKGEGDGHEAIKSYPKPLSPSNWEDYTRSEKPETGITKVVATWVASSYDKNIAVFNFAGGGAENIGKPVDIIDQYVPVGAHTIRLETINGLNVGNSVKIRKAVNAAWIQDLNMDVITDAPGVLSANQWATNGKVESRFTSWEQECTIKAIDVATGTITLNEPLTDALDMKYGISSVVTFDPVGRIRQVGIENIQLISRFAASTTANHSAFGVDYKSYNDEFHAQAGVRIGNAEDVWVRRLTTYHIDGAVNIFGGSRRITVQDVNCLEPVSGTGGERRYSFSNSGGTLVLNQRNYARYTRHGFIVMGHVVGPNVFYNNKAEYEFDANEPHLRWSTGGLFDNVKGRIYVQNRWNNGTAHGWAGANYTLYNNEGKFIISQNQLAANYLFGQSSEVDRLPFVMDEVDPGNVPNFKAYEYSVGKKVTPNSLYIQQLKDRMGQSAVDNVNINTIPACIDESGAFADMFAYLSDISADGIRFSGFKKEVLDYTIPIPLDYTTLPAITAKGESGTDVKKSDTGKAVTFTVSKEGKIQSVYTVNYGFISKAPVSSSGSANQLSNLSDGNEKTLWSQSGTPWVQFYLGDKPVEIEKVSLGYGRDTQNRRQYYFDFEISNDGYNWTKVKNNNWQKDNLGNGHIMGMQITPGVGNNKSDYETFLFPKGTKARLLRVCMYGARNGQGTGTTNSNKYWALDVKVVP